MGLVAAKCPSCGAAIQIPEENDRCFCSYCGAQVLTEAAINFARVEVKGVVQARAADFDVQAGVLKAYHGASTEVVIPEGVHTIDHHAFDGLPVTSITLPRSIKAVRFDQFRSMKTLEALHYAEEGGDWVVTEGMLYSTVKRELLFYPPADRHDNLSFNGLEKATIVNNPYLKHIYVDSCDVMPELHIGNCSALEDIQLPASGIKSLELVDCPSIERIVFPDFVEAISLKRCAKLTRIDVASALDSLYVSACPLRSCNADNAIVLPEGTIEVELNHFQASRLLVKPGIQRLTVTCDRLQNLELAEGVERLERLSVRGDPSNLHVKLPSTMTYMNSGAFSNYITCEFPNLETATIEDEYLIDCRKRHWKSQGRCPECGGRIKGLTNKNKRCSKCGKHISAF